MSTATDKPIQYAPDGFTLKVSPPAVSNRGMNQLGYGSRIATDYMVSYDQKRWYRVYSVFWGNTGSSYIRMKKESYFITDTKFSEAKEKASQILKYDGSYESAKELGAKKWIEFPNFQHGLATFDGFVLSPGDSIKIDINGNKSKVEKDK